MTTQARKLTLPGHIIVLEAMLEWEISLDELRRVEEEIKAKPSRGYYDPQRDPEQAAEVRRVAELRAMADHRKEAVYSAVRAAGLYKPTAQDAKWAAVQFHEREANRIRKEA